MPPPDSALTDDYILDLLSKDALDRNRGFLSNKRDRNAPKPNIRFLRHIVKEADTHNAALLAREREDSRARMRELKRKRVDGSESAGKQRRTGEREGRWGRAFGGLDLGIGQVDGEDTGRREHKARRDEHRRDEHRSGEGSSRPTRRRGEEREHRGSRDRGEHSERRRTHSRRSVSRSRSPEHRSSRHRTREDHTFSKESSRRHRSDRSCDKPAKVSPDQDSQNRFPEDRPPSADCSSEDDSLGPSPPSTTLPRGRGAHTHSSSRTNIDQRFNDAKYDPRTDVDLDRGDSDEEDDWGTSLEALRDRAAWRAKGAQRLREAGFKEGDVRKFEVGGERREKDERDVVWKGRGEGREWDAGKVVGGDGKAGWTKGL